jgi:KDO2-lipid IV(A) lauroyltransferase
VNSDSRLTDFLVYSIPSALIWLLSWLPLRALYVLSDICYFIIWYVIPYRKKLVLKNLSLSFPEKNIKDLKKTAKKSYIHFCDNFIESVAAIRMSKKEHFERYKLKNFEVINECYSAGKDVMLISAHYGNWEWLSLLPFFTDYRVFAVYKTLHNRYFDRMFSNIRCKYGVKPLPKEKTYRTLLELKQTDPKNRLMLYLLGDQRPMWKEIQHWITFMNQETSVIPGPEKIARKMNMAVFFVRHMKIRRGYYESEFVPITLNPSEMDLFGITEKYYRILESMIRESPAEYMWTHDRWKHTWKKDKFKKAHDTSTIS